MKTLTIDFETTFEALPGCFLFLRNDAPSFTVEAISAEYSEAHGLSRENGKGKSIFEIYVDFEFKWDNTLLDSLQTAANTGEVHDFHYTLITENRALTYHVSNSPVKQDGKVAFIIHKLTVSHESEVQAQRTKANLQPLDTIIDQAPLAMAVVVGKDFIIESANKQMLDVWGKSNAIIGSPLLEALPELVDQPFPRLMKEVYETGQEYHGTETKAYINRNGRIEELYFNFIYAPLKQGQMVTGVLMFASDVTTLVTAKKALEESEKRYRDLIANATVATAVYVGPEMQIMLANDAMLRLWGKEGSVIGKSLKEALPELEGQPFLGLLKEVFTTGETYHSKEGRADLVVNGMLQTFYFNFTYKALRDVEGNIYGILNMAVDVTDIVRAKFELKEAEERWRLALHSAELGTWDYYPETKEFICSGRTKNLFGLPRNANVTFETFMEAIDEEDRERVRHEIRKSMTKEGGSEYRVEYCVVGISDKVKRWHRVTGQAFYKPNGEAYRLTGTVLDISDRKKVEEALEQRVNARTAELMAANKELERSNHELEQYAYVASHDLQEPLRKILVYSDMLKTNAKSPSTTQEERLEKIISSAKRMSHLIQDLLNFSKLVKTENAFTKVDLKDIIDNVLDDFELTIKETNAEIHVGYLPVVEASYREMSQLLYNLIGNALKFKKEHVAPKIEITSIDLNDEQIREWKELMPQQRYCEIKIKDNGIGFNEKYGAQIFEIFKRLNTKAKFEGTGIGLAVCRKIVMKHQGLIFAESREGQGATFHIVLPYQQSINS